MTSEPLTTPASHMTSRHWLGLGLALAGGGTVLSGPVALLVLAKTHPQPAWQDAERFVAHYHPIQLLPFALGLVLVAGFVMTIAALHELAAPIERMRTQAALLFTSVFAALITFNYVLQLTFVPTLARATESASYPVLAAFTMSNPRSIAWGLEMWGYGLLGVATWLSAPVVARLEAPWARPAAAAFVWNGPVSLLGAVMTVIARDWLLAPVGLWAFAGWNLLVILMCGLGALSLKRRSGASSEKETLSTS